MSVVRPTRTAGGPPSRITVTGDGWKLPFAFGEPVKLDIEFEADGEPELEIEVEPSGQIDDETPDVA